MEWRAMKKVLIGCLGVAVLFLIILGGAGYWLVHEAPMLDAKLSVPSEVALDSTAELVVTVTNPHEEEVALDSIDIDDAFLEGFQVVAVEPEPSDTTSVPLMDQRSWDFGEPVGPGKSLTVKFTLKPVSEGRFSGAVDVCNPNQDFESLFADVVVKKTLSSKPPEATQP
jgi:hypothetical protein